MKKSIVICCALLLTCSSAAVLSACKDDSDKETQKMFATYETWQDGFYNINMMDGFGRITRSDEQAHGGSYSAKLQPLGSHTDSASPYFYYPMQMEGTGGYNYTDFSKLENVTFWMYNAEKEEVTFDFCIVASVADVYGTDYKSVKTCTLAPEQWTQITYTPDYNALQDMCDITNVAGIAFLFENCNSADIADAPVLYLDDLSISAADHPLAEIKTSTPERGEMQSFDLASSMVYVRLQSGLDYAESYLAAGSDKLPEGVKGGIEFTVTDAEMGTWPRLHFDSRTPQSELIGADRFSLMLYFGTSDPTVTEAELHMFPDTSSEYVEYVATNQWVKVVIDSETMLNNFGDSIGVRSLGLFWLQNGGTGCFNAIDVVRVADIRAEFDEVRIPDLEAGSAGAAYSLAEASLEIDGTPVTAESWSYSVSYKNAALCGDGYPEITLTDRTFTPATGGTYVATYTAQYQGKTYTASAEFDVARRAAAEGELESFDDPAVLDTIRMNSGTGTEYTSPEYLWAGDTRLDGASDGTKGGVEYTIPAVDGGTWPRFYFTSRATTGEIAKYDTVAFDIYLDAPGHSDPILIKMYPETDEFDQYVMPNTWVTVILDGAQCADLISRVSPESMGFFWVQNGARETGAVNIIEHIRITNIRAFNVEEERGEPETTEIEAFDDIYSLGNLTIANASLEWDEKEQAAVGSVDPTADLWMDVSVKARRSLEDYKALKEQGYNAVTLELFLQAADGSTARNAQMQYWANQNELSPSQASVAIGEWVTLTFDLDTYLTALEKSGNGFVTLFWVASFDRSQEYDNGQTKLEFTAHLTQVRIRNVQVAKVSDAVSFGQGAEDFFLLDAAADVAEQTYYAADSDAIPAGRPQAVQNNGAVKLSLAAGAADRWPHLKISADRNMFSDGNTVVLTLYVANGGGAGETLSIRQWPHGADWVVNGELPVGEWVEFAIDAEVLRSVYNWAPWGGIEYTDLFWFTNPKDTSVEIWIAGIRIEQRDAVAFVNAGIEVAPTQLTVEESGESGFTAWVGITSTKGYAYKLTVKRGETVLSKGTDYTVNGDDASVTLVNPEAGDYTFFFESYGGRFTAGSVTVAVKAKEYSVEIANAGMGTVGVVYPLPDAKLMSDGNACDNVAWSYEVKFGDGEYSALEGASFTPDAEGEYTVRYTATYRTRQYTKELVITVGSYEVVADQPEGMTSGSPVTLLAGKLTLGDGSQVADPENIVWTYTVTFADSALYEELFGAIEVKDMQFTPMMAGEYTVIYQAVYGGKTYTTQKTVTIVRTAAAADEVESFDDASALSSVRLESGSDYQKTYLPAGSELLSEGAKGGVSFAVTDGEGGNWPNLHFDAVRMNVDTLKTYGSVVVPMYIGVKAESGISEIQLDVNGVRVFVPVNNWYNVVLDATYFADRITASVLWIQDGGDGVVNAINEVRVAGVYANASEEAPALLDMNEFAAFSGSHVWADSGMSNATKYQRALAPEGMPDGYEIAVRLNADTKDGDQWANVYARTLSRTDVESYLSQGYVTMTFWLYVEPSDASSRQDLQIRLLPDVYSESNIAVGQWVKCEVLLTSLSAQMDGTSGQVRLFWATVPASGNQPIDAIWMTGFAFEKQIDIVDFSSDASASFDPYVTTEWIDKSLAPDSENVPRSGAVRISADSDGKYNVRVHSAKDKELYRSGYTAKILVYLASEINTDIVYSTVHDGYVSSDTQKVPANTWVEIEVPAWQDGTNNDLYDVYEWFVTDGVGYTGWIAVDGDQNVTAVYVAGVWLENPAAAE